MSADIVLHILTPEWNRSLKVDAVFLPGSVSPFEILPGHAPIISTLSAGRLRWRIDGKMDALYINGGVARFRNGILEVCAEN